MNAEKPKQTRLQLEMKISESKLDAMKSADPFMKELGATSLFVLWKIIDHWEYIGLD